LKNALACHKAGVEVVNLEVVGLVRDFARLAHVPSNKLSMKFNFA
jgi:hypothetical protein